jgi:exosortase/archaeosortase family protein
MDAALPTKYRHDAVMAGTRFLNRDGALLLLQLVAFWSVWRWIGSRLLTSGEPAWELIPLISVVYFVWAYQPKESTRLNSAALISAAATLCLYALSSIVAPPLVAALIAMVSLTFVLSRWRFGTAFHPGLFTLLLLCLPITDSLNFFLGYPMRVIVGEATALLLNMQGLIVFRDGVNLQFGESLLVIDAPCSGIKMLWFGMLLATNLAFLFKLAPRMFLPVLLLAFVATMLGNLARASALFYIEGGFIIDAPAWMHSAVGVVAFIFSSIAIAVVVKVSSEVRWGK